MGIITDDWGTLREYPIMEIALSLENNLPLNSGHERKLIGDIIAVRKPHIGIGIKEAHNYLWMWIEGFERLDMDKLRDAIEINKQKFDKRRFCIPLQRLKQLFINFDINKALNKNIIYQPFLPVDEDTFLFIDTVNFRPFRTEGLIFDKLKGRYL